VPPPNSVEPQFDGHGGCVGPSVPSVGASVVASGAAHRIVMSDDE